MNATAWRKSSFSGSGDGNNCIEVACTSSHIHVRESDEPGVELAVVPATMAPLLRAIKEGEL